MTKEELHPVSRKLLRYIFLVDGIMAIAFGVYSWLSPQTTFGTIIAIPQVGSSAFLSILSSLSLFYILLGLTCLIGLKSGFPVNAWIGLLMITRHSLEGAIKIGDIGKDWLVGNPYPDLIIHATLIISYTTAVYFTNKRQ